MNQKNIITTLIVIVVLLAGLAVYFSRTKNVKQPTTQIPVVQQLETSVLDQGQAYQMKLPMVYVRPEPKGHGAGKQIEGYLEPGKKVVLVEDLISTGGSSIRAANALKEEGKAIVQDVVAIVTYEMKKSVQAFSDAGINLTTLTDFSHLLEEVKKEGYLDDEQVATVLEFSKDPAGWWENAKG